MNGCQGLEEAGIWRVTANGYRVSPRIKSTEMVVQLCNYSKTY